MTFGRRPYTNILAGESSFARPAGFAGYVNSFISYINRGIRHM